MRLRRRVGLEIGLPGADHVPDGPADLQITPEAAIVAPAGSDIRVTALVAEDETVRQGQPVLALKSDPDITFAAPMPGRIAAVRFRPGHRLDTMLVFHETGGDRHKHRITRPSHAGEGLVRLLSKAGLWHQFRERPFGRMPSPARLPAAIFVMAVDPRPLSPDPRLALAGRADDFARGLSALASLTDGPIFVCQDEGPALEGIPSGTDRFRSVHTATTFPQGQPGLVVHEVFPARLDRRIWDVQAEDVAAIGALLATGHLPETRLVSVAGPVMKAGRLVRCQPGADMRSLAYGHVRPGAHTILAGSPLDGRPAHFLGPRDRQVTVTGPAPHAAPSHWLVTALKRAARPVPAIPTAALDHALGGAFPAAHLLRAVSVGDRETAIRLGGLSLVGEDLALADYVTGAEPRFSAQLNGLLSAIAEEEAA